jgi:diguanylate cyclase (GGDEF)-like protein
MKLPDNSICNKNNWINDPLFCRILPIINRSVLNTLFLITFVFTSVHAQDNPVQGLSQAVDVAGLSDREVLSKAKSFRHSDPQLSLKLANEALYLSEKINNHNVSAQIHTLLAKLGQESNDIDQSLHHFLLASIIYKNINDEQNYILSTISYIELLITEKRYQKADETIDKTLPIALQQKEIRLIGLTLATKADSYYDQKRYDDAITQYNEASKYLLDKDERTQKKLGEVYKKIAQSYKRLQNREQTSAFYKKTLAVFEGIKDQKNTARTLNTLAEAERYLGDYVAALYYSTRSLEIHKQIDDPEGYAKASTGAGIIYRNIGRYEKSLEHITQALSYYKKVNDVNGIAETSNQLGFIYTRLKQFNEARGFYQLAIDVSKDKIRQTTLASALREMAVIHLDDKNYELALDLATQAHKIYLKENDKLKGSTTARIIANIYRDKENNELAILYYKESLQLATQLGDKEAQIKAQAALAGLLINSDPKEAIRQLKDTLALSIKINDNVQALYAYRKLRQAEKILGNIPESLRYAEEEIKLNEIIQKEKDDNELILVKAKLYSHTMEMELASLREKAKLDSLELAQKNNEIEIAEKTKTITDLELTKNKYANFILALLLGLSVLLVGFIYRLFVASKKHNKELSYLAARDPLTQCYNRRAFFEHMYQDFENSDLLNEYCIIMIDIDHFKNVNDTYGHSAGDEVICGVAEVLQASIGESDLLARFGGEEFCVYLHQSSEAGALELAESMRYKIEQSRFGDISITCCFGVSSIKFNAKSYLELIKQADLALYQSKTLGRNQVTMWNESMWDEKFRKDNPAKEDD